VSARKPARMSRVLTPGAISSCTRELVKAAGSSRYQARCTYNRDIREAASDATPARMMVTLASLSPVPPLTDISNIVRTVELSIAVVRGGDVSTRSRPRGRR
jgi:hypothetical protein